MAEEPSLLWGCDTHLEVANEGEFSGSWFPSLSPALAFSSFISFLRLWQPKERMGNVIECESMSGSKREKGGERKGDRKRRGGKEAWTEGEGKKPKAERKAVEEEEGRWVQSQQGEIKTHAGQVMSKAGALGDQRPWSLSKLRMAPAADSSQRERMQEVGSGDSGGARPTGLWAISMSWSGLGDRCPSPSLSGIASP